MTVPRRGPKKSATVDRKTRKESELQEIYRIREEAKKLAESEPSGDLKLFSALPLSSRTKAGLDGAHFVEMTEIQRLALPIALAGKDILGAAETGSGKTLAFLIPVLERLYVEGWTVQDGLGALILAPTRELAIQIFQVLRRIGAKHSLSAGLVIGGKDLKAEREAIVRMNILVATPGRLLQHMDQSVGFEWGNLQMLVLDEADRILDLGFAKTLDAIVRSLPPRQTLLFSATQTAPIQSLARMSLVKPVTVMTESLKKRLPDLDSNQSPSGQSCALRTPEALKQYYVLTTLPDKIDHLWSFVKQHLHEKTIVFVSSCKQVRFVYETFCKLQPGVPLLHLHGKQKQPKRMTVFSEFCRKKSAVLVATDIAARGLDFPAVDWVVQVDCPEDVETYVHRVGRTARYESAGNSLLLLLPSEKPAMIDILVKQHGFPLSIYYNKKEDHVASPKNSIKSKLQALCSQDPEIKYLAQKTLISYVRSVFLQKNKNVFRVDGLPLEEFAQAIGLAGAPKLRLFERQSMVKNANRDATTALASEDSDVSGEQEQAGSGDENGTTQQTTSKQPVRAIDKMFKKKNTTVLSEHYKKLRATSDESDDDEFLQIKRRDDEIDASEFQPNHPNKLSRRDLLKTKKRFRLKGDERAQKLVFDEDTGEAREALPFQPEIEFDRDAVPALSKEYFSSGGQALAAADAEDKARIKEARREKKLDKKRKAKEQAIGSVEKEVRLGDNAELNSD